MSGDESAIREFNVLTRDPKQQALFASNKIRTHKYTLIPFFPDFFLWKMLWEQFQRKANIYFLVVGSLQVVPGLSPTGRYTTLSTLAAVLIFTFIKTGFEDAGRHRKDNEVNSRKAYVLRTKQDSKFVAVDYTDVSVGDIIRVSNMPDADGKRQNDFPCDICLLSSSDPEGIAYVETANLDGETNLKMRRALDKTKMSALLDHEAVAEAAALKFNGIRMECEKPNNSLYTFTGNLFLQDEPELRIGPDQMMYRGCVLRKVHWVIGIVVFTGGETKIMMNARKPPHKSSSVERTVNVLLAVILAMQLIMCIIGSVGLRVSDSLVWYLGDGSSRNLDQEAALGFLTFIILFNNLIPISLYVSIELVKFFQGRMMEQDLCIYYEAKDMPAAARTTDINEELGQVSYVFSDKTGTLTRNVMTFLKFCINGEAYGVGTTEIGKAALKRKGIEYKDPRPPEIADSDNPFFDERCNDGKWLALKDASLMRDMFTLLGVCHTVVVDSGKYEAESPDEEALVKAARRFGFNFVNRNSDTITIESSSGTPEHFDILEMVEFNSDRKRMSMLVRLPEVTKGEPRVVKLMMKGADTVMFDPIRLAPGQEEIVEKTTQHLSSFGDEGLRTLVLSERTIPESEWKPWVEQMKAARAIIGNDAEKQARIMSLAAAMEVKMTLIGATAIEDKLQEGVPHTVDALRKAGMKVWMLTGDKLETAINIGFACALLHDKMNRMQYAAPMTAEQIRDDMAENLKQCQANAEKEDRPDVAVVIDGASLAKVLDDEAPGIKQLFVELTAFCSSVVCCRVSPKQKADVVEVVRVDKPEAVTLAIGDGANDVPMIQAAHVGIGISGMEGQQAANTADYAIGQFRFLHRLTLVHGRSNYQRLCLLIRYFFYKNALVVLTQFWYVFFNLFTGQSLYEQWTLAGYNVAFTAFPVLIVGVFNREVLNTDNVHRHPKLYEPGLKSEGLNLKNFCQWIFNAVFHSIVIFFVVAYGWFDGIGKGGVVVELDGVGLVMYSVCVVVVNVKLGLHINSFTWMEYIALGISVLGYFAFLAIYGSLPPSFTTTGYEVLTNIGFQVAPWIFFLVAVAFTLARDFIWRYFEYNFVPLDKLPLVIKVQMKDDTDEQAAIRAPMETKTHHVMGDVTSGSSEIANLFAEYDTEAVMVNPTADMFLQFIDKELEDEFISQHLGRLTRYKIGLFICSIAGSLLVLYTAMQKATELEIGTWTLFACSSWLCLFLLFFTTALKPHVHTVMCTLLTVGFSAMSIAHFTSAQDAPDTHPVSLAVILLGLLIVVRPPLVHAIHYILISLVAYVIWYRVFPVPAWFAREFLVRFVEICIVAVVAFMTLAVSESFLRKMFISQKQVESTSKVAKKEEDRSLALLGNVLPIAVVTDMRDTKRTLSDYSVQFHEASLLNSDIVKFTNFSSTKPPAHVVEMLNKMFTKFDRHAVHLGLEKIKTIGDAYICAAGIPVPDADHLRKILIMGMRMNNAIEELNQEGTQSLTPEQLGIKIRVGSATGPVRAGVIGMEKVAYDIFGHTAEESEYMEQTGRPARVQASPKLYEATKHLFRYDIVVNGENTSQWPKTAAEHGVTQYFVIAPDDLMEGSDRMVVEGKPPVNAFHREDIYKFLEDDDVERQVLIQTYCKFQGELNSCDLSFELDVTEADFRAYFRHLANNRFVVEASQGGFLFLSSAVLVALNVESGISHWVTIASFILAAAHIGAVIYKMLAGRSEREKAEEYQGADEKPKEEIDEDAASNSICSPIRAWTAVSAVSAYALPLLVLAVLLKQRDGSSTISVFIILSAQVYVLSFMHLRIWYKFVVGTIHFVACVAVFFVATYKDSPAGKFAGDLFAIVLCYALTLVSAVTAERTIRQAFAAAKKVVYQNAEVTSAVTLCDKLLNNVLPRSIVARLKEAPDKEIVDEVDGASVMFLYLSGLHLDEEAEVGQMVAEFNEFLWVLDTLCVHHKVEKIKTTPYLIVSGCPEANANHARNLVLLARDVLIHQKRYCSLHAISVKIKVGIHSGRVTAGVLGSSKFLYDVFGDTVNFASRLTSSAKPDTIQVSKVTKQLLEKEFDFIGPNEFELKGKGMQEVWLVDLEGAALKAIPVPELRMPNSNELLKTMRSGDFSPEAKSPKAADGNPLAVGPADGTTAPPEADADV